MVVVDFGFGCVVVVVVDVLASGNGLSVVVEQPNCPHGFPGLKRGRVPVEPGAESRPGTVVPVESLFTAPQAPATSISATVMTRARLFSRVVERDDVEADADEGPDG
ncbi:MAG: hypothetical protein HYX32_14500 [Actinobacteria bacterium]|nr:hypothetical protein [Actinomycetota bacterium]